MKPIWRMCQNIKSVIGC